MAPLALHVDADPATGEAAPALVLLHGFTQSAETWAPLRDGLRRTGPHGTRTVAIDLVGHGASPAPPGVAPYRMEACLEQIEAALARLGLARAWWLGYSMGGRAALHLAVARPRLVEGLVLVSTTAGLDDPAGRAARVRNDEALAERIERDGVEAFVDAWLALPLFAGLRALPPAAFAAMRAGRLRNSATGLANSLRGMGTGAMEPLWARLAAIDVPALVLAGERDAKFVALGRRLAAALPRARFEVVPGAGHPVHLERPDALVAAVQGFLAAPPG